MTDDVTEVKQGDGQKLPEWRVRRQPIEEQSSFAHAVDKAKKLQKAKLPKGRQPGVNPTPIPGKPAWQPRERDNIIARAATRVAGEKNESNK